MSRTRPRRRLATLRAARRRETELPPPEIRADAPRTLPPLEPPDDDREFLPPHSLATGPRLEAA
jgi:hypothetical protein